MPVPTIWFVFVAFMLTAYAVLDGFDLGAGLLHLVVARTDEERRQVIASVGPVWDGNEVWLIAAGGTLFFAFPVVYAHAFSGFYLPLTIVLWLLIVRALGIEFRSQVATPVWRDLFDGAFALSSALLAFFFGAALGNVIRGVPLGAERTFFEPLWTDWRVGVDNGILDWYTALCGVLVVTVLAVHGAAYLACRTEGAVQARSRRAVRLGVPMAAVLAVIALWASLWIRPGLAGNFRAMPVGFVIPLGAVASAGALGVLSARGRDLPAFLASAAFIASMLVGAAFAMYPTLLPSSVAEQHNLTVHNAAAGAYSLRLGLYWWTFGIAVAIAYFVIVYGMFRGKVGASDAYGH